MRQPPSLRRNTDPNLCLLKPRNARPPPRLRGVRLSGLPPIQWLPYLLLLPSLAIICLIELYPFIQGVIYSLHKGTLLGTGAFVGLQNYARIFRSPDFYNSRFSFLRAIQRDD